MSRKLMLSAVAVLTLFSHAYAGERVEFGSVATKCATIYLQSQTQKRLMRCKRQCRRSPTFRAPKICLSEPSLPSRYRS